MRKSGTRSTSAPPSCNAEVAQLEATHPSTLPLATLKAAVERLRTLEYRLSEMRAELASEPDVSNFDLALPNLNPRRWNLIGIVLLVAALLLGAGAFALAQTIVGIILAVLLGVAAVAAFVAAARTRSAQRRRAAAYQLREAEIARRLRGRSERADELREAEREREAVLATTGVADMSAAETLLNNEQEHVGQIENAKAEYRGLFSDRPPKGEVEAVRDASAAEAEECRHALSGMGEIGADPPKALAQYRASVERIAGEREKALTTEAGAEAKLAANTTDAEQVAADSEALDDANEQMRQAERRVRIWEETLAAINEAEKATMKKAARFLEQSMSKDVAKITGGRYRRLQVDEVNLAFKVFSPEFGDWVSVQTLSQGTLDQLYLCARLGIVHQVTQPATPPLIFDDPFVTFDDDRARRAFEMLRDVSKEHQVIYLTSTDRYDSLADNVISLPAPDALDTPPPEPARRGDTTQLELMESAAS